MIKINIQSSGPIRKFPRGYTKKYLFKQVTKLWKECIRAFVRAIIEDGVIHIDTGMSRASLISVAEAVDIENIVLASILSGKVKSGHKNLYGQWSSNNAEYKSAALGERLGKNAYTIKFGSKDSPDFEFEFNIVVFQHFLHESIENYSNSLNYNSLWIGMDAFYQCWNENFDRYMPSEMELTDMLLGEAF